MSGTGNERRSAPVAWVLCADARMHRFFEIELAHLGLEAVTEPPEDRPVCLAVVDTDAHPLSELLLPPDCPVLAFGYEPAELADGVGEFLRRPFPLGALESALRRLSAASVTTASPLGAKRADRVTTVAAEADLCPDSATASVRVGDRAVTLTPAEWAVFVCLYENRGVAVSRETLGELLSGGGNSVEVYVCHLRRKLEKPLGRRLFGTVRGKGYILY